MKSEPRALKLSRENGKIVTVDSPGKGVVAVVFWSKNGSPTLPLCLSVIEARELMDMLTEAVAKFHPSLARRCDDCRAARRAAQAADEPAA